MGTQKKEKKKKTVCINETSMMIANIFMIYDYVAYLCLSNILTWCQIIQGFAIG